MDSIVIPKTSRTQQFIYAFWSIPLLVFFWWLYTTVEEPLERTYAAILFSALSLIILAAWANIIWYRTGGIWLDEKGITFKNLSLLGPKRVFVEWTYIDHFELSPLRLRGRIVDKVIRVTLNQPDEYYSQLSTWQQFLSLNEKQPQFSVKLFNIEENDLYRTLEKYNRHFNKHNELPNPIDSRLKKPIYNGIPLKY